MAKKNRVVANAARVERAARAAAAMREQQQRERRRRNLMVGAVVVGVVVIVLVGFLLSRAMDTTGDVDAPATGSEFGVTIGPKDAPHTLVVYEDFLCPFCGQFESRTRDDLASLAGQGKVQVEYRPFNFLSENGTYSARSAGAFSVVLDQAGPDAAKKFHDLLYDNQPDEKGPFPDDHKLVDLAVQAGATRSKVEQPILNHDWTHWVNRATQSALNAGVRATPTLVLDGKVYQNGRTIDELADNLLGEIG